MNIQGSSSAGLFSQEINRGREADRLRTSPAALSSPFSFHSSSTPASSSTARTFSSFSNPQPKNYSILWKGIPTLFVDPEARGLNKGEEIFLNAWVGEVCKSSASAYAISLKKSLEADSQFRLNFFKIIGREKSAHDLDSKVDTIIDVEMARLGAAHNTNNLDPQDLFLLGIGLSRVKIFHENIKTIRFPVGGVNASINFILLLGIVNLYKELKMWPPELTGFFNDYEGADNSFVYDKVKVVLLKRENMGEGAALRRFLANWEPMKKYIFQNSPDLAKRLNALPLNNWHERSKVNLSAINFFLGTPSRTPFEEKLRDSGQLNVGSSTINDLAKNMSKALDSGGINPQWVHALYRWNLAHLAAAAGDSELLLRLVEEGAILDDIDIRRANVVHFAAQGGHESMIEVLKNQTQFSIDFNAQTKAGETPLHFAIAAKSNIIIQALVGASAEINSKNKVDGCTPLARAAQLGKYNSILNLLNLGADQYIKNNQEETPLEILEKFHQIAIKFKRDAKEAHKALLSPALLSDQLVA